MAVVHFNAPANIASSTLVKGVATRIVNWPKAAGTQLLIARRTPTGGDLAGLAQVTGSTLNAWFHTIGFGSATGFGMFDDDGIAASTGPTITPNPASTDVVLMATTMPPTGTTQRFHVKNITSGAAVTHVAGTANGGKRGATPVLDTIIFGGFGDFGNWTGDLVAYALWDSELTDAQIDECWAHNRTSDLWQNTAGNPICLIEGNSLAFTDLAGNSSLNQLGTVTLTGTDPAWTFDGKGGLVATRSINTAPMRRQRI